MPTKRPPETGTVEVLREIQESLRDLSSELARLNQLVGEQVDLQPVDLGVLDLVSRHGPISPSRLVEMLGIHPATLTGVLDRLSDGGWVERRADPEDRRRITVVALRQRGGELARLYRPMSTSIAEICSTFTPAQLETIRGFLVQIVEAGGNAILIAGTPEK